MKNWMKFSQTLAVVISILATGTSVADGGNWYGPINANGNKVWVWQWDPACVSGTASGTTVCPMQSGELRWSVCSADTCSTPPPITQTAGDKTVPNVSTTGDGRSQTLSKLVMATGTCGTGSSASCSFALTAMKNGTANLQTTLAFPLYAYDPTGANTGAWSNASASLGTALEIQGWQDGVANSPMMGGMPPSGARLRYRVSNSSPWVETTVPLSIPATAMQPVGSTGAYVWGDCSASTYYQCGYHFIAPASATAKPFAQGCSSGNAKNPDCSGFTLAEFMLLDLSKMDLTEWTDTITPTAPPQSTVQAKVESGVAKQGTTMKSSANPAQTDTSGQGETVLQLSNSSCQAGEPECTVTATATSNWPRTYPNSTDNTAPVASVHIDWGDGSAQDMGTATISGKKFFQATHTYSGATDHTYQRSYTATATFNMVQPTASGSSTVAPAPVAGLGALGGTMPYKNYTYPTLHLAGPSPLGTKYSNGDTCARYSYTTTFELSQDDFDHLGSFWLSSMAWDDWVVVKVNGTPIMGGPLAGTTRVDMSGGNIIYTDAGATASCNQRGEWSWSDGRDAKPYLRVGTNTIQVDFANYRTGYFDVQFSASSQPYCHSEDGSSCPSSTTLFGTHTASVGFVIWQDDPPTDMRQQERNGGANEHPKTGGS